MPSIQYHLFRPLMRLARRAQGRFPVHDPGAIVRFRRLADRFANALMRPPRRVKVEHAAIGGVPGDWLLPADAPPDPVLLFLHGGGIAFGWNNPMRREVAYLAEFSGLRAFGVDYSLIPEHVYPCAHDECWSVYRALVEAGKQIVLVGESSGGVLALGILLRAKAAGLPQPLLCALISPVVDMGFPDERLREADDAFAHPNFVLDLHKHYLAGSDPSLPDLAPIHADLGGVAPLYILAGEDEILRSEAERLVEAAKRYNVPVELLLWQNAWHSWHALAPQLPEATNALRTFGTGIRQRVSGTLASGE